MVARLSVQVGIGLFNGNIVGLIFGEIAGRTATILVLIRKIGRSILFALRNAVWSEAFIAIKQAKKFPILVAPSSLINAIGAFTAVPIIAALFGATPAGEFALALRIVQVPVDVVGRAARDVFWGHVAVRLDTDPNGARRLFLRTVLLMMISAVPIYGGIALMGPDFFALVFGNSWRHSGTLAAILAVSGSVQFTVWSVSAIVNVVDRQEYSMIFSVLQILALVAMWISVTHFGFNLVQATWTLCAGLSVTSIVSGVLSYLAINSKVKQNLLGRHEGKLARQDNAN